MPLLWRREPRCSRLYLDPVIAANRSANVSDSTMLNATAPRAGTSRPSAPRESETEGRTVDDDDRPVDGNLWGQWVRAGAERWEVVRRSWSIFVRNTTELVSILSLPTTNMVVSLQLMGDDHEATSLFWEELDQRLHNQLSSAVSLVDHTRRLLDYYEDDCPTMVTAYKDRNTLVTEMREASFLRDLRNYLLHYGVPPVLQTLQLARMFHRVRRSDGLKDAKVAFP